MSPVIWIKPKSNIPVNVRQRSETDARLFAGFDPGTCRQILPEHVPPGRCVSSAENQIGCFHEQIFPNHWALAVFADPW